MILYFGCTCVQVGPTICKLIRGLYAWIENKSNALGSKQVHHKLKEILLRVLLQLIQPNGAIALHQGPIDAQILLVKDLVGHLFTKKDLGVAMSIIESVCKYIWCKFSSIYSIFDCALLFVSAILVHNHNANTEKAYCLRTPESSMANNMYGSLFATVLGGENARFSQTPPEQMLLVSLLKLASRLIQTSLHRTNEDAPMTVDNDDEHAPKPAFHPEVGGPSSSAGQSTAPPTSAFAKVPCVADNVLQHHATMTRLLSSLSQSSSSSFVMLMSSMYPLSSIDANSSDPTTVADAVFQILMLLGRRATKPGLIIKPLYEYLKSSECLHIAC